jgi:hypothetical protein
MDSIIENIQTHHRCRDEYLIGAVKMAKEYFSTYYPVIKSCEDWAEMSDVVECIENKPNVNPLSIRAIMNIERCLEVNVLYTQRMPKYSMYIETGNVTYAKLKDTDWTNVNMCIPSHSVTWSYLLTPRKMIELVIDHDLEIIDPASYDIVLNELDRIIDDEYIERCQELVQNADSVQISEDSILDIFLPEYVKHIECFKGMRIAQLAQAQARIREGYDTYAGMVFDKAAKKNYDVIDN